VAAIPPAVSVLADREDWMYNDYAKVIRELRAAAARVAGLEAQALADAASLEAQEREIIRRQGLRWWLRLPLRRLGLLR
jgi:hypothetical protein